MRLVLFVAFLSLPVVQALPAEVHGDEVCQAAFGVGACYTAMSGAANARLYYTQEILDACDPMTSTSCTYRPTARIALDTTVPGEWVLRATTYATYYPGTRVISGSQKALECAVTSADVPCAAAELSRDVVGSGFSSAQWHGEWRLYLVDPVGDEHLQQSWTATGWLAQYCGCPG